MRPCPRSVLLHWRGDVHPPGHGKGGTCDFLPGGGAAAAAAPDVPPGPPIILSEEQQAAFSQILDLTRSQKPEAVLLQGVTGSGKTQVYLRLVQEVLAAGRTAIVLVPEIVLTPQMMRKFASYFGDRVAMLHSGLRMTERYDQWKRIRRGKSRWSWAPDLPCLPR